MFDCERCWQACLTVLADNKRCARMPYLVSVMTGWRYNAGTHATVYMYLNGIAGRSVRREFSDTTRPLFEAGGEDWFLLATRRELGDLQSLRLWHVGSRSSQPDWSVSHVFFLALPVLLHCPSCYHLLYPFPHRPITSLLPPPVSLLRLSHIPLYAVLPSQLLYTPFPTAWLLHHLVSLVVSLPPSTPSDLPTSSSVLLFFPLGWTASQSLPSGKSVSFHSSAVR